MDILIDLSVLLPVCIAVVGLVVAVDVGVKKVIQLLKRI